jgi:hypothetical protein
MSQAHQTWHAPTCVAMQNESTSLLQVGSRCASYTTAFSMANNLHASPGGRRHYVQRRTSASAVFPSSRPGAPRQTPVTMYEERTCMLSVIARCTLTTSTPSGHCCGVAPAGQGNVFIRRGSQSVVTPRLPVRHLVCDDPRSCSSDDCPAPGSAYPAAGSSIYAAATCALLASR